MTTAAVRTAGLEEQMADKQDVAKSANSVG